MRHHLRRFNLWKNVFRTAATCIFIVTAIAWVPNGTSQASMLLPTTSLPSAPSTRIRSTHSAPRQLAHPNAIAHTSEFTYTQYLPVSFYLAESHVITGQVLFRQQGVADIELLLQRCTNTACTIAATTRSSDDGTYLFSVIGLMPDEFYRVRFENESSGNSAANPSYLAYWQSFDIPYPLAGPQIAGGNFDIANIALSSPSAGAFIVEWTTEFTWEGRSSDTDRYVWGYIDALGRECRSDILIEPHYLLAGEQPTCNRSYLSPHPWYVYIVDGEWTNGFGHSFESRNVTFITAQQ